METGSFLRRTGKRTAVGRECKDKGGLTFFSIWEIFNFFCMLTGNNPSEAGKTDEYRSFF